MGYVTRFGASANDGKGLGPLLLGGKGTGLVTMTELGVPVPPGFTISTEACHDVLAQKKFPVGLQAEVRTAMAWLESVTQKSFGGKTEGAPLLVSVRSGAPVSMPGMMDTVLNLGLNDVTTKALAKNTSDERFAYDCYRRLITMFGDTVLAVGGDAVESEFTRIIEDAMAASGFRQDKDVTAQVWHEVARHSMNYIAAKGANFPQDVYEQLWAAIMAVFGSWNNPRANVYREMQGIPASLGTAVTIQAMVFGNLGETSGSGVAFSRNPSTGEPGLFGEFLWNAQGEDVVAGIRTPELVSTLKTKAPALYDELVTVAGRLEAHSGDMQDLEFTVENGHLWLLQTRNGKRSGKAMVKIAVDMVNEKLISREQAILRIEPAKMAELMHSAVDPTMRGKELAKGLPASPGAASGKLVFSAHEAEVQTQKGETVILVRTETSPEDISGMKVAQGIVTARGGMTSHAAVVARGMGKSCVTALSAMRIDMSRGECFIGGQRFVRGETVTIDGGTGAVFSGVVPMVPAKLSPEFATLMSWVDEVRRLRVRTNADTKMDAQTARNFGAEGIGLCRTEHMFFAPDRILAVRKMIVADEMGERQKSLDQLLPMQMNDFIELFEIMDGLPVTIRLLDPPLHEFLPHAAQEIAQLAQELGRTPAEISARVEKLFEANPMLGHRGCRLAISHPEIYRMQAVAIAQAVVTVGKRGIKCLPEIMIPFVFGPAELAQLRTLVSSAVTQVFAQHNHQHEVPIGTMIELPRACMVAGQIAEQAEFFSFGTNDLTQTTFGLSRDDAGQFLPDYLRSHILACDPFATLDQEGVGALMRFAIADARRKKPNLKIGICGEHGGDPESIDFCHREGLDYVSCSPFRVPIARVAAARSALLAAQTQSQLKAGS